MIERNVSAAFLVAEGRKYGKYAGSLGRCHDSKI